MTISVTLIVVFWNRSKSWTNRWRYIVKILRGLENF